MHHTHICRTVGDLLLFPPTRRCAHRPQANKHEVSRSFAAMLQLINNRNINIIKHGTPDEPFDLQLLSADMYHKQMGARLDPSAAAKVMIQAGTQDNDTPENVPTASPIAKPAAKKARKGRAK